MWLEGVFFNNYSELIVVQLHPSQCWCFRNIWVNNVESNLLQDIQPYRCHKSTKLIHWKDDIWVIWPPLRTCVIQVDWNIKEVKQIHTDVTPNRSNCSSCRRLWHDTEVSGRRHILSCKSTTTSCFSFCEVRNMAVSGLQVQDSLFSCVGVQG